MTSVETLWVIVQQARQMDMKGDKPGGLFMPRPSLSKQNLDPAHNQQDDSRDIESQQHGSPTYQTSPR
eukprot:gene9024-10584_t